MEIPILRLSYSDQDIEFISRGVREVLKSGFLTMGKNVAKFEDLFANFVGARYAVAVNSGTSALEIGLRALSIEGKSVIVPTLTFMATPLSVIHAGGRVVFVDVMKENLSIDPVDLRRKIRKDTAGVILVHIGGIISAHLYEIQKICEENGLFLLEDAAHAHGSEIDGKKAGTLGRAAAFSFYPTKVLTTAEGGMITTADEQIHRQALILREHGKTDPSFNIHTELGYNWRFSELHAVLGIQQIKNAQDLVRERIRLAGLYDAALKGTMGLKLLHIPNNIRCAYYKYIVYLEGGCEREALKTQLKQEYQITLPGEVYSDPCHSQPVFKKYPWAVLNGPGDMFPNAEYISRRQVCLPLYPGLKDEEIIYIVDSLKKALAR